MAYIAGGRLAAAVSSAGGLGFIGAGGADVSWLREEIDKARSLTERPFGVNLVMSAPNIEELVELVIKERVPAVSTGAGNPGIYMERFKAAGIKVLPVVSSVALARRLERLGADAVIAEGMQSGGHIGEMSTMCLLPMMADALTVPVIAAGGIADGRGVVAALALGAEGVQMGTVFIPTPECLAHAAYKDKVLKAGDRDTLICAQATGHPIRAIHNRFVRHFLALERQGISPMDLEAMMKGRYPQAALAGEIHEGAVLAGQVCGLVNREESASGVIRRVIGETEELLRRLGEGRLWQG